MPTAVENRQYRDLLSLTGIHKRFPGVVALDNVSFSLAPGEVHVLFGENGAGKSTLINVIAGAFPPDEGQYRFDGKEVRHLTPLVARRLGISAVFQEFSLAPDLTVWENLFLGREIHTHGLLSRRRMRSEAKRLLAELDFHVDEEAHVRDLSRAERQMVEIAKAVAERVKVLILDEPTASLSERETERLFESVFRLKKSGVGIIYVSHRIAEIRRISDRISVLRDGQNVDTIATSAVDDERLVEMMTGRKVKAFFPAIARGTTAPMLEVMNLTTAAGKVVDVSIEVRAGEVVGLAGLVGCGKSEVARAVFGLEPILSGTITLDGRRATDIRPSTMIDQGLCYFPSDRVKEGLALDRPVRENASVSAIRMPQMRRLGLLRLRHEAEQVTHVAERTRLRPPGIERRVSALSGGNRQKVMLMRGLMRDTRIFLFDEPTVGIDVGAKKEIYDLIKELTERMAAVLVVSSDMAEILQLCQRTYVMCEGRVTAMLDGDDKTEERVLSAAFSHHAAEVSQ
ncbi:MAG: sugar ABC transporter ATP-binding protein [Parvibaculaceae bacterium]